MFFLNHKCVVKFNSETKTSTQKVVLWYNKTSKKDIQIPKTILGNKIEIETNNSLPPTFIMHLSPYTDSTWELVKANTMHGKNLMTTTFPDHHLRYQQDQCEFHLTRETAAAHCIYLMLVCTEVVATQMATRWLKPHIQTSSAI